jgi:alpha-beta hydrolase superfamily lysophospholipase
MTPLSRSSFTRSLAIALAITATACTPYINKPGLTQNPPHLARSHFAAADGAVLPVRSWLPRKEQPRAALIALHGFNDYSRFFETPGKYLSERGIACFAYDQRGFGHAPGRGLWSGTDAYIRDLHDVVGEVRRQHPGIPVYLLGESMGGALAIVSMTGPDAPVVDGVILASPAVWSRDTMPWYQRWLLATTSRTVPWLELTGESLHILASDNIPMLRELGRDPLVIKATRIDAMHGLTDLMDAAQEHARDMHVPTLVMYGEKDEVVPKEPVYRMLAALPAAPQVRMAFYPNGYHLLLRDLKAETAWADIASWIADRQAALPSGADLRIPAELKAREPVRLVQTNR